jgi:hypothetical protein
MEVLKSTTNYASLPRDMKKLHTIGIVLATAVILLLLTLSYIYKQHRNVANEPAEYSSTGHDFHQLFIENSIEATPLYQDKTVSLTGQVTSLGEGSLVLDNGVRCYFADELIADVSLEDRITVKGRCLGYDELLEEVKVDQCVLVDTP